MNFIVAVITGVISALDELCDDDWDWFDDDNYNNTDDAGSNDNTCELATSQCGTNPIDYSSVHVPDVYCDYYETGGEGRRSLSVFDRGNSVDNSCNEGDPFEIPWQKCIEDGPSECMGVMWNSCECATSDLSVDGAWKLMNAGQVVGDSQNPTSDCGGFETSLCHWGVFLISFCKRIQVKASSKFLQVGDEVIPGLLSTLFQDDDDFSRFIFEQQTDSSFRIKVKANDLYLQEDVTGEHYLTTQSQEDNDNARFFLEIQSDGSYKIKVKENSMYYDMYWWVGDPGSGDPNNEYVSTVQQPDDDYQRFNLVDC